MAGTVRSVMGKRLGQSMSARSAAGGSRRRETLARYLRAPEVSIPAAAILLIALFCFAGPWIFGLPGPNAGSLTQIMQPLGSPGHLFGTDADGNDLLSRVLYGGRVSLEVGTGTTTIGLLLGSTIGMIAGYVRGLVDSVIMRCLDVLLAFPGIILALAIATYLGPSERNVIFALSFFTVPAYARLSRATVLRLRTRDFVRASRSMGASARHVIYRHLAPNLVPALLTYAFLQVGISMLAEAALSYLGVGIRLPQPSWGNLISAGQTYLNNRPDMVLIPAAMLFLTVLSYNMLANGLREIASAEMS